MRFLLASNSSGLTSVLPLPWAASRSMLGNSKRLKSRVGSYSPKACTLASISSSVSVASSSATSTSMVVVLVSCTGSGVGIGSGADTGSGSGSTGASGAAAIGSGAASGSGFGSGDATGVGSGASTSSSQSASSSSASSRAVLLRGRGSATSTSASSPSSHGTSSRAKKSLRKADTPGCNTAQMVNPAAKASTDPSTPRVKRLHWVSQSPTAPTTWSSPQPVTRPVSTSKLNVSRPAVHGNRMAAASTLRNARPKARVLSSANCCRPAATSQAPNNGAAMPKPPRMKVNAQRAPRAPSQLP